MRPGNEILETFSNEKHETLSRLTEWTFEELEELKKKYKVDYEASSAYSTFSAYVKRRIDLLREAITIKIGNEEQAWDYLS